VRTSTRIHAYEHTYVYTHIRTCREDDEGFMVGSEGCQYEFEDTYMHTNIHMYTHMCICREDGEGFMVGSEGCQYEFEDTLPD
jgi:hypothetical protein